MCSRQTSNVFCFRILDVFRSFSNSAQVTWCVYHFIPLCFNVNSDWSGAVQPILQPGGRHIRLNHQLSRILHRAGRKQPGGRMYQVLPQKTVLRIREVYPGSKFFPSRIRIFSIRDPDPDFLFIPGPGSLTGIKKAPDLGSGSATLQNNIKKQHFFLKF